MKIKGLFLSMSLFIVSCTSNVFGMQGLSRSLGAKISQSVLSIQRHMTSNATAKASFFRNFSKKAIAGSIVASGLITAGTITVLADRDTDQKVQENNDDARDDEREYTLEQKICIAQSNNDWNTVHTLDPDYFKNYKEFRKKIISIASDLTEEQKQLFLKLYDQLDIKTIYCDMSYKPFETLLPIRSESLITIMKYFPIALLTMKNITSTPLIDKKNLTATEQLTVNIAFKNFESHSLRFHNIEVFDDEELASLCTPNIIGAFYDQELMKKVTSAEKEFETQGYQTFYHGRRWEWNFVNDIWRMVCALKDNASQMPDLVALRYRTGTENIDTLQLYRNDLMANGPDNYNITSTTASGKLAEITCMNRTPLSNSNCHGICSAFYVLNNASNAPSEYVFKYVEQMFKDFNMYDLYQAFEPQIQELAEAHEQANEHGELLCIAVRKTNLDDMIYIANGGDKKIKNKTASQKLKEEYENVASNLLYTEEATSFDEESDLTLEQQAALLEEDEAFFVLAVSDIPGEYGDKYTIKSLHSADVVRYAAYQQELDNLFAQMKKAK
ncbi:MAG: hypothetical protein NTZ68_00635 [Candidatus Dependentiae bacterium]|nr:hypothetical protein [Candidatus Dependentiae bacterium]